MARRGKRHLLAEVEEGLFPLGRDDVAIHRQSTRPSSPPGLRDMKKVYPRFLSSARLIELLARETVEEKQRHNNTNGTRKRRFLPTSPIGIFKENGFDTKDCQTVA